jgi:hypothetical protein
MTPERTAPHMTKREAFELLGGSLSTVAHAVGVTKQAIHRWPDPLTPRLVDRVIAAVWRMEHAARLEDKRRWAESQEMTRRKA